MKQLVWDCCTRFTCHLLLLGVADDIQYHTCNSYDYAPLGGRLSNVHPFNKNTFCVFVNWLYMSNPDQHDYMKTLWELWKLRYPHSELTAKHLVAQCSNIHKRQLISQLEYQEI